jgi:peptidoglycan/xylan/chitin deacetylase (PgdA/CDA1 family)
VPPGRVVLWVASIGALALCARSLLLGPVPQIVALAAFILYMGIAVAGVLVPQLEMFGDVISRGERDLRAVALTFDDGPSPLTTPRVLDALRVAGAKATFFVLGVKAEAHPDVLRAIVEAGHAVGVHGYTHDRLYSLQTPRAIADDIAKTVAVVERVTSLKPRWFRPPVGQVSPRTAAGARRAGLPIVAWSARALDGLKSTTQERVLSRLVPRLVPGAIVLLHDASENEDFEPASIAALPALLAALAERGLASVTLDELLVEPGPDGAPAAV